MRKYIGKIVRVKNKLHIDFNRIGKVSDAVGESLEVVFSPNVIGVYNIKDVEITGAICDRFSRNDDPLIVNIMNAMYRGVDPHIIIDDLLDKINSQKKLMEDIINKYQISFVGLERSNGHSKKH